MDEQREQRDEGQRPAAEPTGEVADAELEEASGGLTTCVQKITDRPRADINDLYV